MEPDTNAAARLEEASFANQLRLLARIHPLVEHHWRGLLNGITLNVALLEMTLPAALRGEGEGGAHATGALASLKQAVERSSSKLTQTLEATAPRLSSPDEMFYVGEMLSGLAEMLGLEARRTGCRIELDLPAQKVPTEGRRGYIQQICLNLAMDLLDHMPAQSTLTISLSARPGWADIAMASPATVEHAATCSPDLSSESPLLHALAEELGGRWSCEQAPAERRHRLSIPIVWDEE